MAVRNPEFLTATRLLYDENGMTDDRRIRVGRNGFMARGYLRLAASIRKHRRGTSGHVIIFPPPVVNCYYILRDYTYVIYT